MVQSKKTRRTSQLHDLGYKIFLDRYAQKDMTRETLAEGDTVIVVVNAETGQREVGTIASLDLPTVTIKLKTGDLVERDIEHVDKPLETEPEQMMDRVARGVAQTEQTDDLREEWSQKFRWLLDDWKFVPAGRILAAAGTNQSLTYYNCYVLPSPHDSREGIMTTLTQMTEIMSRGGGVGMNLSSLRPRHSYVKGVNGRSSGSVSWGALYSFVTGLIEQGGCFGPDERILTDKGLIPAAELADRIDAGETFSAQTHKGLRQITARFRNGVKPLYRLTTERGYSVNITEDHKVAVLLDGEITTMPLKYLQSGDEILLLLGNGSKAEYVNLEPVDYERSVMSTTLNTDVELPEQLNEDLAYFLGYATGDGYVHIGKKVNWTAPKALKLATANSYPVIRERLVNIIQEQFALEPTIEDGDGACTNIAVYSRLLMEWLIQHDLLKAKSADICVPEAIFRSPSSVQTAFLAGYFDADGSNRKRKGGYGFDSVSREMLEDVQVLLAANGIVSRLHSQERKPKNWQTIYRLTITGATFRTRFAELIPAEKVGTKNGKRDMYNTYPTEVWTALGERTKYRQRIHDGQSERISTTQLTKIQQRLLDDGRNVGAERIQDMLNVLPLTIDSIELLGNSDVYDFEVDDVHLLSGNGIYTSNSRRGALMLILNDWHPDVFDFINSKREMGQITNANISVGVSDDLMEAVKNDDDWDLVFPDTSDPDYDEFWDGDLNTWINSGREVVHYDTIKARDLWNAIIESAWASAEPGVWFRERSNKMANSWYFNPLVSTNPCVTGDTLVSTEYGYTRAENLEIGMKIRTPAGLKPIEKIHRNGIKRIYRVEFSDGGYLECTADHKLKVVRNKQFEWVAVEDLEDNDRVLVMPNESFGSRRRLPEKAIKYVEKRELNVSDYFDRRLGFMMGVVTGDGTLRKVPTRNSHSYQCRVAFGKQEPEWLEFFQNELDDMGIHSKVTLQKKNIPQADGTVVAHQAINLECYKLATLMAKIGVPTNLKSPEKHIDEKFMQLDKDFLAGLLDGLFSTDGGLDMNESNPLLRFHTSSYKLAQQVRMLLLQFGIHGRIYSSERKKDLTYDGRSMYGTGIKYDVVVMNEGIARFYSEIGLSHADKAKRLQEIAENFYFIGGTWLANVVSVEDTGRDEEIYDVYEPHTLTWVTNGYVSLDCGEQPLGAWSVCNLGAINLSRFYNKKKNDVAWDELDKTIRYATRFLDNVIDTTPYFFQENEDTQQAERRVGLGTMGIAELMIYMGIRYGSDESVEFIDKVYRTIATAAYETSVELAQEKGAFPEFDAEKFLESGYMQQMPDTVREQVREKGIRNVTLLTQAPTGTTGTMVNTSTGIEPFFSWVYYRKSRLGLHEEQVPVVQWYLDNHPDADADNLPDYFATAMDLAPEEHVKVQGAFQRWIDSAISKTCNVPNEYTVEQVSELYQYMYEMGCKGGTIYRDGSRDEQVLMLKGDERAEKEMDEAQGKTKEADTVSTTPHRVYPRPVRLSGTTISFKTPFGTSYITMNSDEAGNPFEVFITVGKAGSDVQADAEGLGRMISLQLRTTAPHNRREMLKLIVDQLQDIGGARPIGLGPNRVLSLPDAVARALQDHYFDGDAPQQLGLPINGGTQPTAAPTKASNDATMSGADMCPECGTVTLIRAEGCRKCLTCGYSEC